MTSPWCTGMIRKLNRSVIFLQWKSDKNIKHYLIQILLAINWRYWQVGKKFKHAYEGSRLPHASALHWNPPGRFVNKKIKFGYFSTRGIFQLIYKIVWWCMQPNLYIECFIPIMQYYLSFNNHTRLNIFLCFVELRTWT